MVHYSCCMATVHYVTTLLTVSDTYESYLILRYIKTTIKFSYYLVTHHRNYFKRYTDLSLQIIILFPPVMSYEILHINLSFIPFIISFKIFLHSVLLISFLSLHHYETSVFFLQLTISSHLKSL